MAREPEALGERLRRIEEELALLRGDLAHEHGRSSAIDDIVEYVLMPAMVLLAGHGHHQQLAGMVGEAGAAIEADDTIHETLRQARVQHLDDWRRYIEGLPKFQASDWLDRHKAANPEG